MKIKIQDTDRGFVYGEFTDSYDRPCSISESSAAGADHIWLGIDQEQSRMHLSIEQVEALLPLLKRFVKTGRLRK